MSWPQWPQSTGWSGSGLTAAAPTVSGLQTPGTTYTPEQWAAMQQQNWQQWVQWQQQYQQWHQQYGEQYQKSLALAAQATTGVQIMPVQQPIQPPLPVINPNTVPPLPLDARPPLPPEEPPRNICASVSYNANVPPPSIPPPPPQPMNNTSSQHYGANKYCNTTQPPPPLLNYPMSKIQYSDNQQTRNQNYKSEFSNKRPAEFDNDNFEDIKKNRWDNQAIEKQEQKQWNVNQPSQKSQSWSGNKSRPNVEELSEAEKNFDKQFEQWEAQFNKWKEQNANHPDKQQYKEYEAKWESWRTQLLERREQMRKKRLGLLTSQSTTQSSSNKLPGSVISPPVGTINAIVSSVNQKSTIEPKVNKTQSQMTIPTKVFEKSLENLETKENVNKIENDLSVLFSQPPKEQRINIRPRTISIKSDLENNCIDSDFLKSSNLSEGGIPGLDLVKDDDNKLLDNKGNENLKSDSNIPDLEAISKGINSILGDAKLLNMLSMVAQNKKIEPVDNTDSQDSQNSEHNANNNVENDCSNIYQSSDSFRNQHFSNIVQNHYNREYDHKIQNEEYSFSSHNDISTSNKPPNFSNFNQNSSNKDVNNLNKFTSTRGDFLSSNRGSNNFEVPVKNENDFQINRRSNEFGLQINRSDNYDSSNRNTNNFNFENRNENIFDYGHYNNFERGPGNFNQNNGSNYNRGQENFYQNSENFSEGDSFRRHEDFNQGPSSRRPGNFNQSLSLRGQGDFNQGLTNRGSGHFNQVSLARNSLNRESDFNQGPINRGLNYISGTLDRGQDFNQGISHRRLDQCTLNKGADFNEESLNRELDFNQESPNKGTDFIQGSIHRRPDFIQDFSHRGSDFRQGSSNRYSEFNQSFPNRGFEFNQGSSRTDFNQEIEFEQGPSNRGSDFYQRSVDKGHDFNNGPQRGTDFNHGAQNKNDNVEDFSSRGAPDDFNDSRGSDGSLNRSQDLSNNWNPSSSISKNVNGLLNRSLPDNKNWNSSECDQVDQSFNCDKRIDEFEKQNDDSVTNFIVQNHNEYNQNLNQYENNPDFNRNRSDRWNTDNLNSERFCADLLRFQNSRRSNCNQTYRESNDKYWDEALILKPVTVVDYGHKSLNKPESNFMEPVQTFDYGHASRNIDKLNENNLIRNIPSRFSKYLSKETKVNRIFPPDPPNISTGNRNDNFYRKFYNNCKTQEKFDRFNSKNNRSFDKKNDLEYEDIEDFEDDPFEEQEFDRSNKEREINSYSNKISTKITEDSHFLKLDEKSTITMIEDLLIPPGRNSRPPRIVIILRGPPGSGKTFLAKLIKDKEVEQGGSAPRILSLDDYFMVEQDKEIYDKETGRKTIAKDMIYEYEECMELAYRQSLEKAFKKTITDGFFPFIILDCINDKVKHFSDMWSFAKQNGFQVYICHMELDTAACTKRNIHHRSEIEIERLIAGWDATPSHYLTLDATSLIQDGCISEVEMEEVAEHNDMDKDEENSEGHAVSKWERMEHSGEKLARLDGTSKPLRPRATMEDYLQLDDDIPEEKPGQKRVRWADLEERRRQEKIRAIGFVVGQTDWDRMMDPTQGSSALTQTKYIERVRRY